MYSYTSVLIDYDDESSDLSGIVDGALVQEDVYLQFDVIQLGFSDDGKDITTIGVVMSPINIFPSVNNPSKPNNDDEKGIDWLRLIMAALAGLVLIMAVSKLPGLIAANSQTSANRQMRRYYRNLNRRR